MHAEATRGVLLTGRGPASRACVGLFAVGLLAACGSLRTTTGAPSDHATAADAAPPASAPLADQALRPPTLTVLHLARRRWHIDVGFAVRDLSPSLAFIARRFPRAKYLFFGFGDRHYLLSKRNGTSTLSGALIPGAGVILVTAIENSPAQAFGGTHVLEFELSAAHADEAQSFIRRSLSAGEAATDISPLADGPPYEGSLYYGAAAGYSALHTCNTWAAEALRSAGLKVRPRFVLFAGQLWGQARKIAARALVDARSSPFKGIPAPE